MGKNRPTWGYELYVRYLKEGRGQGTGKDYIPWILIHDFPSLGVSSRIPGRITGRIHHLLSRNEALYFYILDNNPDVLDIREQFPLRLNETMDIARTLNIRHPWKNDFPFVMTTDFLITGSDGYHARTVKLSDELNNPRIVEKFTIEQTYWSSRGIDWTIVTEKQIDIDKALNLQWLYSGETIEDAVPDPEKRRIACDTMLGLIDGDGLLPPARIASFEENFRLRPGSAITIYKHLIIRGDVSLNLSGRVFS